MHVAGSLACARCRSPDLPGNAYPRHQWHHMAVVADPAGIAVPGVFSSCSCSQGGCLSESQQTQVTSQRGGRGCQRLALAAGRASTRTQAGGSRRTTGRADAPTRWQVAHMRRQVCSGPRCKHQASGVSNGGQAASRQAGGQAGRSRPSLASPATRLRLHLLKSGNRQRAVCKGPCIPVPPTLTQNLGRHP